MTRLRAIVPDLIVLVGILLIALGAAMFLPGLGPIIIGAGLIAAVRYGGR